MAFQQIYADGGIGRMDMGWFSFEMRTVRLNVNIAAPITISLLGHCLPNACPFGELTQIVQQAREGHSA